MEAEVRLAAAIIINGSGGCGDSGPNGHVLLSLSHHLSVSEALSWHTQPHSTLTTALGASAG